MQSKIVKVRHNKGNRDDSLGIPTEFKEGFGGIHFFECTPTQNGLLYKPVNMSDAAEVVQTQAAPLATNTHSDGNE